jgi:diguanylate cyclase (GGDEF)-like protein
MSETTDTVAYPTTLSPGAWQRVEAVILAALPAPRATELLDELRRALVADAGEPDWDDLASENARLEQEIEVAASVDPLTGLRNRTRFLEDLRREFATARRYETPLSLIVLDVDGLRDVNAQQGFEAGDRLLLVLSELLLSRLRVSDIAARIGDDDFAVILPHTPLNGARALSERILDTLGDWLHAGASTLSPDVTSGADLLQRADRDLVTQRAARAQAEPTS